MTSPLPDHLQETIARIKPLDELAMAEVRRHQDELTKPPGSLGRLERLSIQLAGITRSSRPHFEHPVITVLAADHGVSVEHVSAYPSEVTAQMVSNFVNGGAAINVLARQAGARVAVVDIGVDADLPADLPIIHRKLAHATANMAQGPAMSVDQAQAAVGVGLEVVAAECARGADLVALGEMGIANTTAASAMVAALTGAPVEAVTGRGTGIDDATWQHKIEVIERALRLNHPVADEPVQVLARVGGFEIAGLVGVMLGAAALHRPVILDGFITSAAALAAVAICPTVRSYLIPAHRSVERGHSVALEHLELEPLLMLDLRLGEGSGAALALPIVSSAVAILNEMTTFADAGVSESAGTLQGEEQGGFREARNVPPHAVS